MRLNEINFNDAVPVDGYGPGFFRVSGQVIKGAMLILPGGVSRWGGYEDTDQLVGAATEIDVLFVGTGSEIAHVPASLRETLEQAGVGVEPMGSASACRTYNILLSEGRRIGLAVLPV